MSKPLKEFQISDLAAWTTVADLKNLITKGDGRLLALAWGDQSVADGKAPPYQAKFETATDLENARRAFGLSASYDIDGILTQNVAFFALKRGSPKLLGSSELSKVWTLEGEVG